MNYYTVMIPLPARIEIYFGDNSRAVCDSFVTHAAIISNDSGAVNIGREMRRGMRQENAKGRRSKAAPPPLKARSMSMLFGDFKFDYSIEINIAFVLVICTAILIH